MNKRSFLKKFLALGVTATPGASAFAKLFSEVEHIPANELAADQDFWAKIRDGYRLKSDYINLENGYYCFLPQETLNHFIEHVKEVNYQEPW